MKPNSTQSRICLMLCTGAAVLAWGIAPNPAAAMTDQEKLDLVRSTGVADYNGNSNWAYSPPLEKFVDGLPGLCNDSAGNTNPIGKNNLDQCIPVGVPDTTTYPGSDYYELEIVQFREQMHSDLPVLNNADAMAATAGGTLLRGYRQTNGANTAADVATLVDLATPHNLGVTIVASKDRPVRIKFTNSLPTGTGGDLFIPTDTTVMGSGPGPLYSRVTNDPQGQKTDAEVCAATPDVCFSQNRATLHLHGGHTPWISDGTAHQWITPDGQFAPDSPQEASYSKGVSVAYVPDMWFDADGNTIPACAAQTFCGVAGATNNPGPGAQTYFWTNNQSARLLFYHEHAWGITRLGVYAGGVAGYLITDDMETSLLNIEGLLPDAAHTLPLIIQDKTFVDANTIIDNPATPETNDGTDPTWIWGSQPGTLSPAYSSVGAAPVTGDLWWPHVYVPAQNPYNPDFSGTNPYGRWHYGPWFWPPTDVAFGVMPNPYYDAPPVGDGFQADKEIDPQPPEIPSTPNPSWGAEAFMDTPVINGTAYPKLDVEAATYRFRILNGAHDRFWNLQFYVADNTIVGAPDNKTEVKMVEAIRNGYPGQVGGEPDDFAWPADGREGGVPDPARRGPAMVQIGVDGGFLPAPVVLPNRPINWNVDPTTFTAGLVLQQNQGGGTLMLGPAERADVIVDFSQFAGRTLILYNDAPAPWPALDPHYDYYTGSPDYSDIGAAPPYLDAISGLMTPTRIGLGPNTRTLMQIVVAGPPTTAPSTPNAVPANLAALETAFTPAGLGVFANGQDPIIVGQTAYNGIYPGITFPGTWPNWGVSRITDRSISFKTPEGATVTAYPMEPKAIQDEMGEVYDDFGRMSAKLGLELAKTTALNQTFVMQNFVDPSTEIVSPDQIQIWKITSNGVDTHPVHFHLFDVQLINRVGWDGFIYLPDANELGWKDVVRVNPLEDTIVALRPIKVPTPFTVPNSLRPLNPAYPLGEPAGFTNLDPVTAQVLTPPTINEVINFGHEYLWHCHILSHEEQDMMRPIIYNSNSLLYTLNTDGFWQWSRGDWSQISANNPDSIVASGSFAYADFGANGLWQWNGYDWRRITSLNPVRMVASENGLYVDFNDGLYQWNRNAWRKISSNHPLSMIASESGLYADFSFGLYQWNETTNWRKISSNHPVSMVASDKDLYADFSFGLYRWNETTNWRKISSNHPTSMVASDKDLYADFSFGLYQWNETSNWKKISQYHPLSMVASGHKFYANFDFGLYDYSGIAWTKLSQSALSIDASGSVLYANFGGVNGVRKYEYFTQESGSWSSLSNSSAVSTMEAAF